MMSQKSVFVMYLFGILGMIVVLFFTWVRGEAILKAVVTCLFTPIILLYVFLLIETWKVIKKGKS